MTRDADTTPADAPTVRVGPVTTHADDGCSSATYADVEVDGEGDIFVLDVAGRVTLDPGALDGTVVDASSAGWPWQLGEVACGGNWDFAADGDARAVRVGAFDMAGSFSGWSAPQAVSYMDATDADAVRRAGSSARGTLLRS